MSEMKAAATKGRRPAKGAAKGAAARAQQAKKTPARKPDSQNKQAKEAARRRAERARLRALLPPLDPHYETLWDRGAAKAYASRNAAALRVALRSVHKKRLAAIEKRTRLDRQEILNRAIARGWEALHMTGTDLEAAASKLRREPSAAAGTVSLYPTAETLRIFRQAAHPQAKAVLLQTGLNLWKK